MSDVKYAIRLNIWRSSRILKFSKMKSDFSDLQKLQKVKSPIRSLALVSFVSFVPLFLARLVLVLHKEFG